MSGEGKFLLAFTAFFFYTNYLIKEVSNNAELFRKM